MTRAPGWQAGTGQGLGAGWVDLLVWLCGRWKVRAYAEPPLQGRFCLLQQSSYLELKYYYMYRDLEKTFQMLFQDFSSFQTEVTD